MLHLIYLILPLQEEPQLSYGRSLIRYVPSQLVCYIQVQIRALHSNMFFILCKLYTLMDDMSNSLVSLFAFQKSSIDSSSEEGLKPKEMNGTISFENVHFSYPNRKDVKASSGNVTLKMTRQ